jgi:acyl-CoA thioester hydrolase
VEKEIPTLTEVLKDTTEISVRFNEADPLGIVWHGHYVRYFEDGRESFGKRYGFSYLDCYAHGLAIPVVSIKCDYKKALRYGDTVTVETTFVSKKAAKIFFEYRVVNSKGELVASGSTVQVFVEVKTFQLQLTNPVFFENWKVKWNLE